jgi:hypothetical protein
MGNHRSKTANIWGFYLAHNTLLGLTELKHSLPIVYKCFCSCMSFLLNVH